MIRARSWHLNCATKAMLVAGLAIFTGASQGTEVVRAEAGEGDPKVFEQLREWLKDASRNLQINADPVLRAIVCRVGYETYSLGALSGATGIPPDRLMKAARDLEALGLVSTSMVSGGHVLLAPKNQAAGAKLRELAEILCSSDDDCAPQR